MTPRVSPILAILGLLWVVVVAGLAVLKPAALALSTVTAVLQFSTILALVALGQALVIVCGGAGIDISVGGMVSLAVVLAMLLVKAGLPGVLLPVLCLALGLLLGLVNGFLVTRLRLLPLIATLGTFYVYSGAAVALTGGAAQAGVPAFLLPWGRGAVGGLPLPIPDARAALCSSWPAFCSTRRHGADGSMAWVSTSGPRGSLEFRSIACGSQPMARVARSPAAPRS